MASVVKVRVCDSDGYSESEADLMEVVVTWMELTAGMFEGPDVMWYVSAPDGGCS